MVISDIHSNIEALRTVLSRTEDMRVYCLGDIVGYGASPNEVVDELREIGASALMGNHDYAVATGDPSGFNVRASMAVEWTRRVLEVRNLKYLQSLPKELIVELRGVKGHLTHGSPDDPLHEYVDPLTHSQLFGHYLAKLGARFLGLGHTHVPFVSVDAAGTVFNPGSVGQPRDGDRRASYAVVTETGGGIRVENFRIEYDFETAASKIRTAGLPVQLADRLNSGT